MRPPTARSSGGRWSRRFAIVLATGAVIAGCGGAATGAASPSAAPGSAVPPTASSAALAAAAASATSAPAASASPAPSLGPATADLTFAGATGLGGTVTKPAIRCGQPSFDGLTIDVFAQPADPSVLDRITVSDGKLDVRVAAGSGAAYTERDFSGTGVTGFDSATGATIDTKLTETTPAGVNPGKLGAVTSLKGTIACNDQRPGSSTLTISGDIPAGSLTGPIGPVNVRCAADGSSVSIIGLTTAGSTPVLLVITIASDHVTIAAAPKDGTGHLYAASGPGVASVTATGARVSGDAVAQADSSAPTLHLAGDVTCG